MAFPSIFCAAIVDANRGRDKELLTGSASWADRRGIDIGRAGSLVLDARPTRREMGMRWLNERSCCRPPLYGFFQLRFRPCFVGNRKIGKQAPTPFNRMVLLLDRDREV
jgi:hypothetical protein